MLSQTKTIASAVFSTLLLGACQFSEPIVIETTPSVARPIIILKDQSTAHTIHVCTLKAFTEEYRSEHTHRGRAKLSVQQQCQERFDAMFCKEKDIVCKTYE